MVRCDQIDKHTQGVQRCRTARRVYFDDRRNGTTIQTPVKRPLTQVVLFGNNMFDKPGSARIGDAVMQCQHA